MALRTGVFGTTAGLSSSASVRCHPVNSLLAIVAMPTGYRKRIKHFEHLGQVRALSFSCYRRGRWPGISEAPPPDGMAQNRVHEPGGVTAGAATPVGVVQPHAEFLPAVR